MRYLFVPLLLLLVTIGISHDSFAEEVTGKLSKITVTIVDESGKEALFTVSESGDLKKIKVGDKVKVKVDGDRAKKVEKVSVKRPRRGYGY